MSILTSDMKVIKNCPKILSLNILRVFSDHHLLCQNWRQYLWTSLCQFNFFVNLLHSLGVSFFDIWHFFWQLDIFLTTWHLFDILGANHPWAPLPMWPIPLYPIAHMAHTPCTPYPLCPYPPVGLIAHMPHTPCISLPMWPIAHVAHTPLCPIADRPHTPVPHCSYPCTPYPLCPHCP